MKLALTTALAALLAAGCAETTTLHENVLSAPCRRVSTPELPAVKSPPPATPENAPEIELTLRVFTANEMFERDIGFAVTPGRGAFIGRDMVARLLETVLASPNATLFSAPSCRTRSGMLQQIEMVRRKDYVAGYTRADGVLKPVTAECDAMRLAARVMATLKDNVIVLSEMGVAYSETDMVTCAGKFRWRELPGGGMRHGTLEWGEPIQRSYSIVMPDGVALRPGTAYLAEMTGGVEQGCSNLRLASPRNVQETHDPEALVGDKTRVVVMWEVTIAEQPR